MSLLLCVDARGSRLPLYDLGKRVSTFPSLGNCAPGLLFAVLVQKPMELVQRRGIHLHENLPESVC